MTQDDRKLLARQQADTLAGILAAGAATGISDAAHTAEVLLGKRRREAALAAPRLAEKLGGKFAASFDAFAREIPYPRRGGPAADAAAFGGYLDRRALLPPEAIFEQMLLDIRTSRRFRCARVEGRWTIMFRVAGRVWVL